MDSPEYDNRIAELVAWLTRQRNNAGDNALSWRRNHDTVNMHHCLGMKDAYDKAIKKILDKEKSR